MNDVSDLLSSILGVVGLGPVVCHLAELDSVRPCPGQLLCF